MRRLIGTAILPVTLFVGLPCVAGPPSPSDPAPIDRLVAQLGSEAFSEREEATEALEEIGTPALDALTRARGSSDPEVRHRACLLVEHIRIAQQDRLVSTVRKLGGRVAEKSADNGRERFVDLSGTKVLDRDLAQLQSLDRPSVLHLSCTRVTDAGLAHLRGLVTLRELDLSATRLTDTGLAHLSGMKALRRLNLSATTVTDTGLAQLRALGNLKELILTGTQVTDQGVAALQKARPGLQIVR
jgi:hypothetical protein